jgi:hypothetical protein
MIAVDVHKHLIKALIQIDSPCEVMHWSQEGLKLGAERRWFQEIYDEGKICYEGRASFQASEGDVETSNDKHDHSLVYGAIYMRGYPWMKSGYLRDNITLSSLQQIYSATDAKCTVSRSTIQDHIRIPPKDTDDAVFGLFASQDIKDGNTIVEEDGTAVVTNSPDRCDCCCQSLPQVPESLNCCSTRFCSSTRATKAHGTYRKTLCGKEFSFLEANASAVGSRSSPTEHLMRLRALAISLQEGATHPLKSSFLGRLTPQCRGDREVLFDFTELITNPTRILQTLVIDIFADHCYDTWVLCSILYRLRNNQSADAIIHNRAISASIPSMTLLNHSCEPNVRAMGAEKAYGSLELIAARDIKEGEELLRNYVPLKMAEGDWPRQKRQEVLSEVLGGLCGCAKCIREERGGLGT